MSDYDQQRKAAEDERRAEAARRAEQRRAARAAGEVAPTSALDSSSAEAPILVAAAAALAVGGLVIGGGRRALTSGVVGTVLGAGILLGGLAGAVVPIRRLRDQSQRPRRVSAPDDLQRVFEEAAAVLERSRRLDEQRKIELLGALRTGLDELRRRLDKRGEIAETLAALPPGEADAERQTLQQALDGLDRARASFLTEARKLAASVHALEVGDDETSLSSIKAASAQLQAEADAAREIDATLVAATRKRFE